MLHKALLSVVVAYVLTSASAAAQDLSRVMVDLAQSNSGIDIDQNTVRREKFDIVMVQLTLGKVERKQDLNQDFSRRVAEVTGITGLKLGAYHLLTQSSSGVGQADGFLDNLRTRCNAGQKVLLAVDWEQTCFVRKSPKAKCDKMGYTQPSYLADFIQEIRKKAAVLPVVFTGQDTLAAYRGAIINDRALRSTLTTSPLWIAQYHLNYYLAQGDDKGKIFSGYIFPQASSIFPWNDWVFWQYAGGKASGPTKRISTSLKDQPADLSFFNGTREDFGRFFNSHAWTCNPG